MSDQQLYGFEQFSLVHLGVVTLVTAVAAVVILVSRRRRGTTGLRRWEYGFGAVSLLIWIVAEGYWMLPARFNFAYSLPLHFCDLAALLVPLVLFFRKRILYAVLYFWGIGFSMQAIVTPDLNHGPAQLAFWLFWSYHALVVGTAVYIIVVHEFRPTWRDYFATALVSIGYVAVMLPVNVRFGYNYGFLGQGTPGQPSLIDVVGPWPARVPILMALTAVVFAALVLPWVLVRRRSRGAA